MSTAFIRSLINARHLFAPNKTKSLNLDRRFMYQGDVKSLRRKYKEKHAVFLEELLKSDDPIEQFGHWFQEAKDCPQILEPNAMCLATCTKSGRPSARFVLLKEFGPDGFVFFTNGISRKGEDLEDNPQAALVFYWECLHRQIRVEGTVEKVSDDESIGYFKSRPIDSQLSAAASRQSTVIESRDEIVSKVNELKEKYGDNVEKPEKWGGYTVKPVRIEFWQGQTDRLHDRILFERNDDKWKMCRLAP